MHDNLDEMAMRIVGEGGEWKGELVWSVEEVERTEGLGFCT